MQSAVVGVDARVESVALPGGGVAVVVALPGGGGAGMQALPGVVVTLATTL